MLRGFLASAPSQAVVQLLMDACMYLVDLLTRAEINWGDVQACVPGGDIDF